MEEKMLYTIIDNYTGEKRETNSEEAYYEVLDYLKEDYTTKTLIDSGIMREEPRYIITTHTYTKNGNFYKLTYIDAR